jgi:hypothetical protein
MRDWKKFKFMIDYFIINSKVVSELGLDKNSS